VQFFAICYFLFKDFKTLSYDSSLGSGFHDGEVKSKHLKKEIHGNVSKPFRKSYPHGESSCGIPENFTTAKSATQSYVTQKGEQELLNLWKTMPFLS
jgi:hypothetical protein